MATVCKKDDCTGCKLCSDVCPVGAVTISDSIRAYNAVIDETKCINCELCCRLCPQNSADELSAPIEWRQGWSLNSKIRANSSSGGMAAEISKRFIERGGEVLTCRFKNGGFGFAFFDNTGDLSAAAGSKYVKSDPEGIYRPLLEKLKAGRRILMIALPCQIAAAKTYTKNHENLYTVDLVCHGTPSPKILRYYLKEKGIDIDKIGDIRFRQKSDFGLRGSCEPVDIFGCDAYMYAFLKSATYTENCYNCRYARLERISDMTLGDSWGSELNKAEQKKGVSLILCQTGKGRELLAMSKAELKQVDLRRAAAANGQLKSPARKHRYRERFMENIEQGREFEAVMFTITRTAKNIVKAIIGRRGGVLLSGEIYSLSGRFLYTDPAMLLAAV